MGMANEANAERQAGGEDQRSEGAGHLHADVQKLGQLESQIQGRANHIAGHCAQMMYN